MSVRTAMTRREALVAGGRGMGLLALAQVGGVHIGIGQAGAAEKLTLFVFSGLNLPVTAKEVAKAIAVEAAVPARKTRRWP